VLCNKWLPFNFQGFHTHRSSSLPWSQGRLFVILQEPSLLSLPFGCVTKKSNHLIGILWNGKRSAFTNYVASVSENHMFHQLYQQTFLERTILVKACSHDVYVCVHMGCGTCYLLFLMQIPFHVILWFCMPPSKLASSSTFYDGNLSIKIWLPIPV
jgi:hypothetical protein